MRYADILTVGAKPRYWEEWFWNPLDFGGRFDEAKYVRRPAQRGKPSEEVFHFHHSDFVRVLKDYD